MKKFILIFLIGFLSAAASYSDNLNLPPDPGEAGKATLQGIDSDGDGVRDDIQRFLAVTYTDSERQLFYYRMTAKRMQSIFDVYQDKQASRALSSNPSNERCFQYLMETYKFDIRQWLSFKELESITMNTVERSRAYIQYMENLSGTFGPDVGDYNLASWKTECDFDPDALPN